MGVDPEMGDPQHSSRNLGFVAEVDGDSSKATTVVWENVVKPVLDTGQAEGKVLVCEAMDVGVRS